MPGGGTANQCSTYTSNEGPRDRQAERFFLAILLEKDSELSER